jgi:hypothetical protein
MKRILIAAALVSIAATAHAGMGMQGSGPHTAEPLAAPVPDPATEPAPAGKPVRKSRFDDAPAPKLKSRKRVVSESSGDFVYRDNCLRFTGSRLLRDDRSDSQRCASANGRVYLREDMDASAAQLLRP